MKRFIDHLLTLAAAGVRRSALAGVDATFVHSISVGINLKELGRCRMYGRYRNV